MNTPVQAYPRPDEPNKLGIDVETADAAKLLARLRALKTTHSAGNAGPYGSLPEFTQIHLDTEMTEPELGDWLYRVKHGAEYVGVFTRP